MLSCVQYGVFSLKCSSVSVRTLKSVFCHHKKDLLIFPLDIKIKTFEKVVVKKKKKIVGVLSVEMDA